MAHAVAGDEPEFLDALLQKVVFGPELRRAA